MQVRGGLTTRFSFGDNETVSEARRTEIVAELIEKGFTLQEVSSEVAEPVMVDGAHMEYDKYVSTVPFSLPT